MEMKSNLILKTSQRLSKILGENAQNQTSFSRPVLKLHEIWNWEWTLGERLCIYHIQLNNNKNNKNSLRVKGSHHTYEKCVEANPIPTLIYPKSWHQMVAGTQAGRHAGSQPFSKCCRLLACLLVRSCCL